VYMHLKLLVISNPILLFFSWKSKKTRFKIKNASVGNRTQNVRVTAHHLYHRPKDDLPETHLLIYLRYNIGDLFKKSIRFVSFLFINSTVYGIWMSVTSNLNDNTCTNCYDYKWCLQLTFSVKFILLLFY